MIEFQEREGKIKESKHTRQWTTGRRDGNHQTQPLLLSSLWPALPPLSCPPNIIFRKTQVPLLSHDLLLQTSPSPSNVPWGRGRSSSPALSFLAMGHGLIKFLLCHEPRPGPPMRRGREKEEFMEGDGAARVDGEVIRGRRGRGLLS